MWIMCISLLSRTEVLERSDYISIHVSLKDSTRNFISADSLSRIKPDAYLINLSRGGVVDERDLYDALTECRLKGAALDVHAEEGDGKLSPLAGLSNVILTPHIGAMTIDSQKEIGKEIIRILESCAANKQKQNIRNMEYKNISALALRTEGGRI
jgi:phosphoglycerate dehydrogenase-like enzyme